MPFRRSGTVCLGGGRKRFGDLKGDQGPGERSEEACAQTDQDAATTSRARSEEVKPDQRDYGEAAVNGDSKQRVVTEVPAWRPDYEIGRVLIGAGSTERIGDSSRPDKSHALKNRCAKRGYDAGPLPTGRLLNCGVHDSRIG